MSYIYSGAGISWDDEIQRCVKKKNLNIFIARVRGG
jgi:hypothetical protein